MADTVYTEETIQLQNGEEVVLRPLPIKLLKEFNVKLQEMNKTEIKEETEALDFLVDLCAICLRSQFPLAKNREQFEEVIDLASIYKILDVCGGVKLNDPNLQAAALAAMNTTE
jgi:hypothetical protein